MICSTAAMQMDMPLEGLHEETGPGVLEAAITASTKRLAAADKAAMFKTFAKIAAQKHGLDGDVHGQVVTGLARASRGTSISR